MNKEYNLRTFLSSFRIPLPKKKFKIQIVNKYNFIDIIGVGDGIKQEENNVQSKFILENTKQKAKSISKTKKSLKNKSLQIKCLSKCLDLMRVPISDNLTRCCNQLIKSIIKKKNIFLSFPQRQYKTRTLICSAIAVQKQMPEIQIIMLTDSDLQEKRIQSELLKINYSHQHKKRKNIINDKNEINSQHQELKYKKLEQIQSNKQNIQQRKIHHNSNFQVASYKSFFESKAYEFFREKYKDKEILFIFDEAHNIPEVERFSNSNKSPELQHLENTFKMIKYFTKDENNLIRKDSEEAINRKGNLEINKMEHDLRNKLKDQGRFDYFQQKNEIINTVQQKESIKPEQYCILSIFYNAINYPLNSYSRYQINIQTCIDINVKYELLQEGLNIIDDIFNHKKLEEYDLIQLSLNKNQTIEILINKMKIIFLQLRKNQIIHMFDYFISNLKQFESMKIIIISFIQRQPLYLKQNQQLDSYGQFDCGQLINFVGQNLAFTINKKQHNFYIKNKQFLLAVLKEFTRFYLENLNIGQLDLNENTTIEFQQNNQLDNILNNICKDFNTRSMLFGQINISPLNQDQLRNKISQDEMYNDVNDCISTNFLLNPQSKQIQDYSKIVADQERITAFNIKNNSNEMKQSHLRQAIETNVTNFNEKSEVDKNKIYSSIKALDILLERYNLIELSKLIMDECMGGNLSKFSSQKGIYVFEQLLVETNLSSNILEQIWNFKGLKAARIRSMDRKNQLIL